jgi:hypothetical protein
MTSSIALILSNLLIAGVIFSHLVLTTPIIFKTLDEDSAASFLRAIFPRYYLLLFLISLLALLILYFQESALSWWLGINIFSSCIVRFPVYSYYQCQPKIEAGIKYFLFFMVRAFIAPSSFLH